MGYMKHDAIVVTSWKEESILEAAAKASELGLHVIGPSDKVAFVGIIEINDRGFLRKQVNHFWFLDV